MTRQEREQGIIDDIETSNAMLGDGKPRTMQEREGAAEAAMWRDLDKMRANYEILMVDKLSIPAGTKLAECYETETEWVVVGEPWRGEDVSDPRYHNCDAMGCCTLIHVVARMQKRKSPNDGDRPQKEAP